MEGGRKQPTDWLATSCCFAVLRCCSSTMCKCGGLVVYPALRCSRQPAQAGCKCCTRGGFCCGAQSSLTFSHRSQSVANWLCSQSVIGAVAKKEGDCSACLVLVEVRRMPRPLEGVRWCAHSGWRWALRRLCPPRTHSMFEYTVSELYHQKSRRPPCFDKNDDAAFWV